jgi:hypothetical protein
MLILLLAGAWLAYDFVYDRAPPHRFVVRLDEPANSAQLTLGNSEGDVTSAMSGGPSEFKGSRNIADSAGSIRVEWADGSATKCQISYITNGEREPHDVVIRDRSCPEIGSHVQH